MTHLTKNLYAVKIPDKSIGVGIANDIFYYTRNSAPAGESLIQTRLLCGSYRLLGVWPGMTEQQAAEVVEWNNVDDIYKEKCSPWFAFSTALESLASLMESKGITGTVAVIEKLTS